jgi:hypothetical protein
VYQVVGIVPVDAADTIDLKRESQLNEALWVYLTDTEKRRCGEDFVATERCATDGNHCTHALAASTAQKCGAEGLALPDDDFHDTLLAGAETGVLLPQSYNFARAVHHCGRVRC